MNLRIPPEVELQDVRYVEEGLQNTEEESLSKDFVVLFVRKVLLQRNSS